MKKIFITTYTNPDMDGISSMISLSRYLELKENSSSIPVVFGDIDSESKFVLKCLGIENPKIGAEFDNNSNIFLVDTHHISQLNQSILPDNVSKIYDHHPSGNPEAFPNAQIINETIGAVATIIFELYQSDEIPIEKKTGQLLYAGIISNTLNLTAPTTTNRDKIAVEYLQNKFNIPDSFSMEMFEARSDYDSKSTREILRGDFKEFDLGKIKVGIAQLEGCNIQKVISRGDIMKEVSQLREIKNSNYNFLSAVDILSQKTFIIGENSETEAILSQLLNAKFIDGVAKFDRIMLRKSDLVPPFKEHSLKL